MGDYIGDTKKIDFSKLVPYQSRQFVPDNADLLLKETVVSLYQQLLDRTIETDQQMEKLILDRSELQAAIDQQGTILYIQMTCQTDDPDKAKAFQDFVKTIEPAVKSCGDQLDRKMIHLVDTLGFNNSRYDVYFRKMRCDMDIFRTENIPLQTEDSLLIQQYQTVTGAMTVQFQGQEYPISQMRKFQENPDRAVRQAAFQVTAERYLQDENELDEIFNKMVSLRNAIAKNSGFDNYRDYKFQEYHRFDYTPEDCRKFHEAVEEYLVPIQRKMHQVRAEQMNLSSLRPWDLSCDPLGREPLKPAEELGQLTKGLCTMFDRVDCQFSQQFQMMRDEGLLDLESRKGKAPGGYQTPLSEARKPFIFGNTIGTDSDLELLTHEGGHAFHSLACAEDALLNYRHPPTEFCEVASMSMELLAADHLDVFYSPDQQKQWWRDKLEDTVQRGLINVAIFDAFQHWIYENPSHTVQQRQQQWVHLNDRFGTGLVDWTGLEEYRASQWHVILHFFQCPFYYIEYGIAQLGALGIWQQSREDAAKALQNYKKALALGGSRPLGELFSAAGLEFDFSEKTIQPLARILLNEWQKQL